MKLQYFLLTLLPFCCFVGRSQDTYYSVQLTSLALSEGKLPGNPQLSGASWRMLDAYQPFATLDGAGEAFVSGEALRPWDAAEQNYQNTRLVARIPKGSPLRGRLFLPKSDLSGMVAI